MAVLFPREFQVIRREKGGYVDGIWTPAFEAAPVTLIANIQPASASDYTRAVATMAGRRITAMKRCYTAIDAGLKVAGEDGYPGDVVLYKGDRWLVIGSADWDSMGDSDTAHMRYMLTLEAEHAAGEVMA